MWARDNLKGTTEEEVVGEGGERGRDDRSISDPLVEAGVANGTGAGDGDPLVPAQPVSTEVVVVVVVPRGTTAAATEDDDEEAIAGGRER